MMASASTPVRAVENVAMGRSGAGRARPCRIALYSHDTMGIGHLRRNLLIAQALAGSPPRSSILLLAGAREASAFPLPSGVDCLTLPAYRKQLDGRYQPRCLDVTLDQLVRLRSRTLASVLEAFEPDVLIVDKVARGALGELDAALASLRARGRTRCILGLRDVLDDPETVRREWAATGEVEAIRTYYDDVWIYGDPSVYDLVSECQLSPEVAARVIYTGYLDQRPRLALSEGEELRRANLPQGRLMLGMVGGGQDGARLAEAFAQAPLPPHTTAVLVTGPHMPREVCARLHRRARAQPNLRVLDFVPETGRLLGRADRVIAMGGYNTVCEVLSHEKHALIVPRVQPRREQLIRAERLRDLGLLDLLRPEDVSPGVLGEWLARELPPLPPVRERIDLDGLSRLPQLLHQTPEAAMARAPSWRNGLPPVVFPAIEPATPCARSGGV